jgi:hypothetical protein
LLTRDKESRMNSKEEEEEKRKKEKVKKFATESIASVN